MTDYGFGRGRTPTQQRFNNYNSRVTGPEDADGSRLVQGEVTANVPFAVGLAGSRKGGDAAGMKRLGIVSDPSSINFYEGQVLIKQIRSRVGINRGRNRNDPVYNAFTSFRGLPVYPEDVQDPIKWDNTWVFAGVCKSNVEMNEIIGTNEVASAIAGGLTVKTNNSEIILAGSFVKVDIPSPNEADRAAKRERAVGANTLIDDCAPSVVPEKPEDGIHFLAKLMHSFVNKFTIGRAPDREARLLYDATRRAAQNPGLPLSGAELHLYTEYVEGSTVDFANALLLGARLGLVTLNLPTDIGELGQLSNSFSAVQHRDIDAIGEPRVQLNADPAAAARVVTTSVMAAGPAATALQSARGDQMTALYRLLGLSNDNVVTPSATLRELIMLHRVRGLLPVHKDFLPIINNVSVANVGSRRNGTFSSLEQAADKLQINRARDGYMSFHVCFASQAARRFARATMSSRPGGECDIVF